MLDYNFFRLIIVIVIIIIIITANTFDMFLGHFKQAISIPKFSKQVFMFVNYILVRLADLESSL